MGGDEEQRDKPMHPSAAWQNGLSLARCSRRCGARTRNATCCQAPAMPNGRCRMHGGASPGAPPGQANGMWKHGLRSIKAIERRRAMTATMRAIRRALAKG